MKDDRFIRYLEMYYKEHKTINDISRDTIVIFEETPLKIGEFLASIRKQHKLYTENNSTRGSMSKTSLERYEALDKMNFEWTPGTKKQQELEENDICLLFIQEYYKKYKNLDNLPDTFTIDEKEYSIKNFLAHIRANHKKYISNENSKGSNSPTAIRRYEALDEMGFDWTPVETTKEQYENDDKYMRYIIDYYHKNKSLDNIPKTVVFEGVELNIDIFLTDRRKKHKESLTNSQYQPSELELRRWQQLEEISFDWTPSETKHQELMENDKYIRYLQQHYQTYKTINNIKAKQEVIFEGEVLKIGDFINDMRKKHLAYASQDTTLTGIATELALKRYKELDEMEFDWRPSESQISVARLARTHGLKTNKLRRYIERFNGDIDKAIKICKASSKYKKSVRKASKGTAPSLTTVAQEFDIDMQALTALLNKPQLRVRQPNITLMYDENTNLRQYCIDNGLNYTVIQKAVKLGMKGLCEEDLQSLINRCIVEYKTNGQQRPSTWIYSKYGNEVLVSHLLTYLKLDSEAILYDMTKNCISLDQAMENNCFARASKQQFDYLEFIYRDVVKAYKQAEKSGIIDKDELYEAASLMLEQRKQEFSLTDEEVSFIDGCFEHYTTAVEQYRLFDVGFEKDEDKKVQKIIAYHLDEDEIEEAFFMPLKFDQKALIGRDSELYKRRVLLKNIIVSWSYISEEEQQEKVTRYNLTQEEIKYVVETRHKIDETKQKVLKK